MHETAERPTATFPHYEGAERPISGQDCLNEKARRSTTPHAFCLNANLLKWDKPRQIHVSRNCRRCPRPTQRIREAFRGGLPPTWNHRKSLELANRCYLSHLRLLKNRVLLRRGFLSVSLGIISSALYFFPRKILSPFNLWPEDNAFNYPVDSFTGDRSRPHGPLHYRPPAPESFHPLHFVPAASPLSDVDEEMTLKKFKLKLILSIRDFHCFV